VKALTRTGTGKGFAYGKGFAVGVGKQNVLLGKVIRRLVRGRIISVDSAS
jgi:hypothetical protein